jgi:hypothetical protein
MSRECFADEIAIDFPSLEPAVERMREAFLGERPDADGGGVVKLEIYVSRRDLREGTAVPVEVPLRGVCRECGGRGEVWTEPCETCRGAGVTCDRRVVRISVPRGGPSASRRGSSSSGGNRG